MKTVTLTPDDVIELRILLRWLEAEQQFARRQAQRQCDREAGSGKVTAPFMSDDERNARKAAEVITRILK